MKEEKEVECLHQPKHLHPSIADWLRHQLIRFANRQRRQHPSIVNACQHRRFHWPGFASNRAAWHRRPAVRSSRSSPFGHPLNAEKKSDEDDRPSIY